MYNVSKILVKKIVDLLQNIQENLYERSKKFRKENTHEVNTYKEFKDYIDKGGFVYTLGWN